MRITRYLFVLLANLIVCCEVSGQDWPMVETNNEGGITSFAYLGPAQPILEADTPDFQLLDSKKSLERLEISHLHVSDKLTSLISKLDNLTHLRIGESIGAGETEVAVGAYRHLRNLKRLQYLELVDCLDGGNPSRSDFTWLDSLKQLETLRIFGTITSNDLNSIIGLAKLKQLSIGNIRNPKKAQLAKLGDMQLTSLTLGSSQDGSLVPLLSRMANSKTIEKLSFTTSKMFSNEEINCAGKLSSLKSLSLSGVSSRSLDQLKPLSKLEFLSISLLASSGLNDTEFVKSMPKLQTFFMFGNLEEGETLDLSGLTQLNEIERIILPGNFVVGKKNIEKLRALPKLKLLRIGRTVVPLHE